LFSAGVGHVEFGTEGGGAVNTAVHCAVHEALLAVMRYKHGDRVALEIFSVRINELHGTCTEVMNS
jgi:hypothetical protein